MHHPKVEALIPDALELVETHLARAERIPKVYKGYISSMGAALNQSGLLPTLAIFSAEDNEDQGDRRKLLRILTELLRRHWPQRYQSITDINPEKPAEERRLLLFAAERRENPGLHRAIRRDLLQASVAVKLSLRTFNLIES